MSWKKTVVTLIPAIALALGASGDARGNFVVNGDFTQYTGGYTGGGYTNAPSQIDNASAGGYTNLTGWTVSNIDTDSADPLSVYSFLYQSTTVNTIGSWYPQGGRFLKFIPQIAATPDGGNFVSLDGFMQNAALEQTVSGLTPGQQYTLSFNWAAAQYTTAGVGSFSEGFAFGIGNNGWGTPTVNLSYGAFSGWMAQSEVFTANSTSEVLTFLSGGTPEGGPPVGLLNDVQIVPSAVPEPSALALMCIGLMVIAFVHLRRRVKAPAF